MNDRVVSLLNNLEEIRVNTIAVSSVIASLEKRLRIAEETLKAFGFECATDKDNNLIWIRPLAVEA